MRCRRGSRCLPLTWVQRADGRAGCGRPLADLGSLREEEQRLGKRLVITEKPSVARDIAAALGGFTEGEDSFESDEFVVTWAVGHLLELAEPRDYDTKWRSWSIKLLPILPEALA